MKHGTIIQSVDGDGHTFLIERTETKINCNTTQQSAPNNEYLPVFFLGFVVLSIFNHSNKTPN
jgi:uncharacterized membrane protein YadS